MTDARSIFSTAEQGLGFVYQPRLALLKILSSPESTSLLIEKSDNLEFDTSGGRKSLASLKHKAGGDRLTDLDADFWKSIRVWLAYYLNNVHIASDADFVLFTTATIAPTSSLAIFVREGTDPDERLQVTGDILARSQSQLIGKIGEMLSALLPAELRDFYRRITILDGSPRIDEIPQIVIDQHLRTIHRESRQALFERLEGWWMDLMIKVLSGQRTEPVFGHEVSDRLSSIAEEYRSDMRSRQTTDVVLQALLIAVWRRKPNDKMLIHSDQGSQFTSTDRASFLRAHNVEHSMSRRGNCHDNAVAESLFNLLKRERIRRRTYKLPRRGEEGRVRLHRDVLQSQTKACQKRDAVARRV